MVIYFGESKGGKCALCGRGVRGEKVIKFNGYNISGQACNNPKDCISGRGIDRK